MLWSQHLWKILIIQLGIVFKFQLCWFSKLRGFNDIIQVVLDHRLSNLQHTLQKIICDEDFSNFFGLVSLFQLSADLALYEGAEQWVNRNLRMARLSQWCPQFHCRPAPCHLFDVGPIQISLHNSSKFNLDPRFRPALGKLQPHTKPSEL